MTPPPERTLPPDLETAIHRICYAIGRSQGELLVTMRAEFEAVLDPAQRERLRLHRAKTPGKQRDSHLRLLQ